MNDFNSLTIVNYSLLIANGKLSIVSYQLSI